MAVLQFFYIITVINACFWGLTIQYQCDTSIKHDNDNFTYGRCTNAYYRFDLIKALMISGRFRYEKSIYDTKNQTIGLNT